MADGSLEQWLLAPAPLSLLVGLKVAAHWLLGVLPLLLVAPLLGWQYGLDQAVVGVCWHRWPWERPACACWRLWARH
jgi:heme exporter protein B